MTLTWLIIIHSLQDMPDCYVQSWMHIRMCIWLHIPCMNKQVMSFTQSLVSWSQWTATELDMTASCIWNSQSVMEASSAPGRATATVCSSASAENQTVYVIYMLTQHTRASSYIVCTAWKLAITVHVETHRWWMVGLYSIEVQFQ